MSARERPPFDLDAAFDTDYLHFYAPYTTEERSDEDATLLAGLLGLCPGEKTLDLGCGTGRIATRLATLGCAMTGLDRSEAFLALARAAAAAQDVDVLWLQADQRRLHFTDEFDAAYSWFTSFGYDDDRTSRDILARVCRALVPGGRFLIETMNVFQVALDDEAKTVKRVAGDRMIDVKHYDADGSFVSYRRTVQRAGHPDREFTFSVRLFTPTELRSWLLDAGFVDAVAYGGSGEPFDLDSERLIMVARKSA